jgi:hypothetical protein
MFRQDVLPIAIALLWAGAGCRTATKQSSESPPTAVRAERKPFTGRPTLGAMTTPPHHPRDCGGRFLRPWLVPGAPRIRSVSERDAGAVTALMRQFYDTTPLMSITGRDGLIDATTGCCSNVPDDCSIFTVRFSKHSDREWNVVDIRAPVP